MKARLTPRGAGRVGYVLLFAAAVGCGSLDANDITGGSESTLGTADDPQQGEGPPAQGDPEACLELHDALLACEQEAEAACGPAIQAAEECFDSVEEECRDAELVLRECIESGGECQAEAEALDVCFSQFEDCEPLGQEVHACFEQCEEIAIALHECLPREPRHHDGCGCPPPPPPDPDCDGDQGHWPPPPDGEEPPPPPDGDEPPPPPEPEG